MERSNYQPLAYPDHCQLDPSRLERLLMWFPIVGWLIANELAHRRLKPCEASVYDQLKIRTIPLPKSAWGSDLRAGVASEILLCIYPFYGELKPIFIPDDPLRIMIQLDTGDLCEVETIMMIEKRFKIRLRSRYGRLSGPLFEKIIAMTYSQFVDYLTSHSPRFH